MSCPDDEILLLTAEDPDAASEDAVRHIEVCDACAKRLTELRGSLHEWRSTDLIDKSPFDDAYFAALALDGERRLDHTTDPSESLLRGPGTWWRTPAALACAVAACLVLSVSLLDWQSPEPVSTLALEDQIGLEEMARDLGKSLLSDEELALLDVDDSLPFATWSLEQYDLAVDLPPLPLTTTLADDFELLDSESLESVALRL